MTPKERDGLTEIFAAGKLMKIFGSNEFDREMIVLKKILEQPVYVRLVFVLDDILFRRISTNNLIHSCGFDSVIIWRKSNENTLFRNSKTVSWWLSFLRKA